MVLFITALGCISVPPRNTVAWAYEGPPSKPNEAIIRAANVIGITTTISAYKDRDKKPPKFKVAGRHVVELHVLPGKYTLSLKCEKYKAYASVFVDTKIVAGKHYRVSCIFAGNNSAPGGKIEIE